jgi:hypothetical protein
VYRLAAAEDLYHVVLATPHGTIAVDFHQKVVAVVAVVADAVLAGVAGPMYVSFSSRETVEVCSRWVVVVSDFAADSRQVVAAMAFVVIVQILTLDVNGTILLSMFQDLFRLGELWLGQ